LVDVPAPGELLDPDFYLARHCNATMAPVGVPLGTAFLLRPDDRGELSVNCLELASDSQDSTEQLRAVKVALMAKGRTIRPKHWFAIVRTAYATDIAELHALNIHLTAIYTPELPHDRSHSSILGLPSAGSPLADLAGIKLAEAAAERLAIKCDAI
jgi:hypothetical protein